MTLDLPTLMEDLRVERESSDFKEFEELVRRARELSRPKAVYLETYIERKGKETVTIEGVVFTSAALRRNLDKIERVFPFVLTCGEEIDALEASAGDLMQQFWLDTVKQTILHEAYHYLSEYLSRRFGLQETASMSPGAADLEVWSIEEQRDLFSILGDVEAQIGVTLTESLLMVPTKSISGILFPTETSFQSCQLCRRADCPQRRVPFDPKLWESLKDDLET